MLIDCNRCDGRGFACADCVVTALPGAADEPAELGEAEERALRVLADARLVSPLRLCPPPARAS
jgi:ferredoxin